jgi:hypothetical protein
MIVPDSEFSSFSIALSSRESSIYAKKRRRTKDTRRSQQRANARFAMVSCGWPGRAAKAARL